ncbi:GIY-YIG nuclease family protein, partial [Candidatus Pelagibacter sp.]|nr:GIY-YIG nuclease family protein [Candidatus Pelagibacter sp.]
MKHFVYMILTKIDDKYISYVGYTNNLLKRLLLHNSSKGAKFTRGKKW